LPLPGDPLLDEAASKVRIDKAAPGAFGCFAQPSVGNSFAPCKTGKFLRFENPQTALAPRILSYYVG
jgi:hypothetical protein